MNVKPFTSKKNKNKKYPNRSFTCELITCTYSSLGTFKSLFQKKIQSLSRYLDLTALSFQPMKSYLYVQVRNRHVNTYGTVFI